MNKHITRENVDFLFTVDRKNGIKKPVSIDSSKSGQYFCLLSQANRIETELLQQPGLPGPAGSYCATMRDKTHLCVFTNRNVAICGNTPNNPSYCIFN